MFFLQSPTLKKEALFSFETSTFFFKLPAMQNNDPEDRKPQHHHWESLKPRK